MIKQIHIEKYKKIGYNVYILRTEKRWTQERLSIESNVERAKISRIENFQEDALLATIFDLSDAFGVDSNKILDLSVEVPIDYPEKKAKIPKGKS